MLRDRRWQAGKHSAGTHGRSYPAAYLGFLSSEGKLQETRTRARCKELDGFPYKIFWSKQLSQNTCVWRSFFY